MLNHCNFDELFVETWEKLILTQFQKHRVHHVIPTLIQITLFFVVDERMRVSSSDSRDLHAFRRDERKKSRVVLLTGG